MQKKLSRTLLSWYEKEGREFPWRKISDPYRILVTEILLQKTSAGQVESVYSSFFSSFPTLESLWRSDVVAVKREIKPLGLIKRADFLKEAALEFRDNHEGKIPNDKMALQSIRGIGRYTANAILCFAFGEREAVVDKNVARVISRFRDMEVKDDLRRDEEMWDTAKCMVPRGNEKSFNWALIDLGAILCTRRNQVCKECPLSDSCMLAINKEKI